MKTNNKKKIVVSVLALSMGACLAGSISGSVAWYQYSTRTSAAIVGTSAGTSRNLLISADNGENWSQHVALGTTNFRPASVYGTAGNLNFVDHPVYKTAILPAAQSIQNEPAVYKATYSFVFKCEDSTSAGSSTQQAKEVYLTKLNIVDVNTGTETEQSHKDITPAVRIEIDAENDFLISKAGGTTTTYGYLNLNGNKNPDTQADILDRDGYDANDVTGELVEYRNAAATEQDANRGKSYTCVAPSTATVLVDDSDAYSFQGKTNKLLTTTATSGNSTAVNITVWIEGWQQLDGTSVWDSSWLAQNFELQFQFACEANRY